MPFSHENLRAFLDSSKPSADLLCCLASPFELDAERLKVLLKVVHPVPLLSPGLAFTPEHLPKHHPLRQALFPHACHEAREQYPSSAYRCFNALGICPQKRVGIGQDVVFVFSLPSAEASEDHLVVDLL